MSTPCQWETFDNASYEAIYDYQKSLVQHRLANAIPDTLLLGEHPHVITMGRKTQPENIINPKNIPVVAIERGGDVTYHGPGQLVGYPIFQLTGTERDLHQYLRSLEEVIIRVLAQYDIEGTRNSGWTGVWIGEKKIASIGVAVKQWVTYHGFALNVSTDLSYFEAINPCGLDSQVMTSMQELLGNTPNTELLHTQVTQKIAQVFQRMLIPRPLAATTPG